ncbi:MAG: phage tail protein [Saprospiraceae bacterium]
MPNPSFGLIAEGPTDHAVLENILIGHFNDPDLTIRPLQPLLDSTDGAQRQGGWTQVVAYCQSSFFQGAFEQNDYLVVQIDTDCLHEKPFELDLKNPVQSLVNQVIGKMESLITDSFEKGFWETYHEKILFAVAVDELECWLLPLFYADKNAAATNNCLHKLNTQLAKNKHSTINPHAKGPKQYDKLSRPLCKPKGLRSAAAKNPSLGIFIQALPVKI